jgi:hypothetical protein
MRRPSPPWARRKYGRFVKATDRSLPVRLWLWATLATLALSGTALTACGGSSPSSPQPRSTAAATSPTSTPPTGAPAPGASTHPPAKPSSSKSATPATASTAKPSAGARPATGTRVKAALAQLRSCMRQNGAPLPQPGATRSSSRPRINTTTPQFKAALAKCRPALTAALRQNLAPTNPPKTSR